VITDLDVGGAERCLARVARHMRRQGWPVAVCSLMPSGSVAGELTAAGVPCYELGLSSWRCLPAAALRLATLIARYRPYLVHTFLFHANVLGRVVARLLGVPRVISSVRVAEPRRWHLAAETLTCRLADRLVCVCASVAEHMRRRAHVPPTLIDVIPNGIEFDRFAGAEAVARSLIGLPEDAQVAITVARLDVQKGFGTLLQATAGVLGKLPNFYLLVVGTGALREQIQKEAQRLRIADRVLLLGRRDDVPQLLRAADLFVLPSRWEGMPNALLEAMAAGLPVVATAVHGSRELVTDGLTGRLVPVDDAEALERAIIELLQDPAGRRRLADAGQRHVAEHFSLQHMLRRYESLYESLC
jgi:starch synthase (maltosyl-transferring)